MGTEANDGLFCELYWGTTLNEARSFGPELPRVLAAPDETVGLPLYGFTLPEEPYLLAERTAQGYRIFVPPTTRLERSRRGDAFRPVPDAELQRTEGRAWVELTREDRLRLSQGELSLLLAPSVAGKRPPALGLKDFGWLAMVYSPLEKSTQFGTAAPQCPRPENRRRDAQGIGGTCLLFGGSC